MSPPARDADRVKVFVSYSRQDLPFVDRLQAELSTRGVEVTVDREDIEKGEEWWERIQQLIVEADTILFVLSPTSATSPICKEEVEFAAQLNKRFLPLVAQDLAGVDVPNALSRLNYIFFIPFAATGSSGDFDEAVDQVTQALETDIRWVREHTRLGSIARRWDERDRPADLVLRGNEISSAEAWLTSRPTSAPAPTNLHLSFITESRRAASQRQRLLLGLSLAALVIALGLAGFAYWQRSIAVNERATAIDALRTQSRLISQTAQEQMDAGMYLEGALLALEVLPDKAAIASLRRDWPVTPEARQQLIRGFSGHWSLAAFTRPPKSTKCARFDRTGRYLVTCSFDGTATVWDVTTGNELLTLRGHTDNVEDAAFNKKPSIIVTGSKDGTMRLWDVTSGIEKRKITVSPAAKFVSVDRVFVSPSAKFAISISTENGKFSERMVRSWDLVSGRQNWELPTIKNIISHAALSPDGQVIAASTTDGVISFWRTSDGRLLHREVLGKKHNAPGFDFDPSYNSGEGYRVVWVQPYPKNTIQVLTIAKTMQNDHLESLHLGQPETEIKLTYAPYTVAFSGDGGRIISWTSNTRRIEVWDAMSGEQIALAYQYPRGEVGTPMLAPDGHSFITPKLNFGPVIWPVARRLDFMTLGQGRVVTVTAMSPDGRFVAIPTRRFGITLYDTTSGKSVRVLKGHRNYLRSLEFSKQSSRLVSSAADGSVRIWNVRTGKQLQIWYPLGKPRHAMIGSAVLSPDERRIVAEVEKAPRFRIWSIADRKDLTAIEPSGEPTQTEPAYSVTELRYRYMSFAPDGSKIVTISRNGMATVRDGRTAAELVRLVGHEGPINTAVFSPDGQLILTASNDRTARLWSPSGRLHRTLSGHASSIKSAAFSPDGRMIATISTDATIRLWDATNGDALNTLQGHKGPIESVDFSKDGSRLVTASMDTTVRVWDVQSGAELAELRVDGMLNTRRAQFGPDGRTILAMAGYDAALWKNLMTTKTPLQSVVDRAKNDVPRCLTLAQRRAFDLPLEPPRWCITGPGRQHETDPSHWQPKWPYQTAIWKDWLMKRDRGDNAELPTLKAQYVKPRGTQDNVLSRQ